MADKLQVIKLATDMIHGRVSTDFSDASKNSAALVEQLIELNGGKSDIDIKTFHRGNPVFDIVEVLIPEIVHEGLQGNEFFFNLVEYRNIALGDDVDFWTEDKSEFIVADSAYGITGIRRQRLGEKSKYTVETSYKIIKVYEELKRLMAHRTDFNTFIVKVGKAMTDKLMGDVYTAFKGVTASTTGLNSTYVLTGSYSEDALLDVVTHVETANEAVATIIGTKKALRKIATATVSDEAKSDLYNMGYYGKFNGTNMVWIPQRHKVGTDEFLLEDNKIYVIAGEDKPIKVVNVGEGILSANDPLQTPDMTQNYLYAQEFGVGVKFNTKMGFVKVA